LFLPFSFRSSRLFSDFPLSVPPPFFYVRDLFLPTPSLPLLCASPPLCPCWTEPPVHVPYWWVLLPFFFSRPLPLQNPAPFLSFQTAPLFSRPSYSTDPALSSPLTCALFFPPSLFRQAVSACRSTGVSVLFPDLRFCPPKAVSPFTFSCS